MSTLQAAVYVELTSNLNVQNINLIGKNRGFEIKGIINLEIEIVSHYTDRVTGDTRGSRTALLLYDFIFSIYYNVACILYTGL